MVNCGYILHLDLDLIIFVPLVVDVIHRGMVPQLGIEQHVCPVGHCLFAHVCKLLGQVGYCVATLEHTEIAID